MDGFTKSLDDLLHFADSLKLREKELEQQHQLNIDKLKKEYELQVEIDKRRNEQLQEHNRSLTEKVARATQREVDFEQNITTLKTKNSCFVEEIKHLKEQLHEKQVRIDELDKIVRILKNDKTKVDGEFEQLKLDKQLLDEKLQQMSTGQVQQSVTTPPTPPQTIEEIRALIGKAVAENDELKNSIVERDNEIRRLNEQLNKSPSDDPQMMEQRCLQLIKKLKTDFSIMYENQSKFFLEKLDLLKREQRDNIAKIYEH